MIWLLLGTALAADGYYHPIDVAPHSELYAKAADAAGAKATELQEKADVLARGLRTYRLALDLLGDRAPAAERERLEALQKQYNREFAVLQAFTDTMVEDFDGVFSGAMERAATANGSPQLCEQFVYEKSMPGMPARPKKNPECQGDDLNPAIAKAMDTDPELQADVQEILGLQWPAFSLDLSAQAPVGGSGRSIQVASLFQQGAQDALKRIDREDEDARLEFQAAMEEGAATEELKGMVEAAKKVEAETAAKRGALGAPVLGALDKVLAKEAADVGLCANPVTLGGCTGEDASSALIESLLGNKKVAKQLP